MIQLAGGSGFIGSRLASLFPDDKFQILFYDFFFPIFHFYRIQSF